MTGLFRLVAFWTASILIAAVLFGCSPKTESNLKDCKFGRLGGDQAGALSKAAAESLIQAINRGSNVRVKVTFLAGDKDSRNSEVWFEPVSITILDSVVYAESSPLKWPPSRFSWTNGDAAVGAIAMRASSNGKLSWVQKDESSRSESAPISWCLS